MFKQGQIQQQQRKPFSTPFVSNKSSIPVKEPKSEYVDQIFDIVREGNISKIISAISEKNISLDIRNKDGESLLHVVLENNSIGAKEKQKYDLINLLINHGAPINAFNGNNVTPLHLAAKYQYYEIVKLLLDKNAKVNSIDNLAMNPLHYAVQGNEETCKKEQKKVGSIIPKSPLTTKDVSSKELKNITLKIIDILNTKKFNNYFQHMKNTFVHVSEIYSDEFETSEISFLKSISEKLSDSQINDVDKKEFIRNKIIDLTNGLNSILLGKLQNALGEINIGPHNITGWGPITKNTSSKTFTRILPNETPLKTIENIETKFNGISKKIFDKIKTNSGEFRDISQKLTNNCNNAYIKLNSVIQLNENAKINQNVGKDNTIQGYSRPTSFYIANLDTFILNKETTLFDYQEMNIDGQVAIAYPVVDNDRTGRNLTILRGTTDEIAKWKKGKIQKYPLTDDTFISLSPYTNMKTSQTYVPDNGLIGPTYPAIVNGYEIMANVDVKQAGATGVDFSGERYYYISKFIFAMNRITIHLAAIEHNLNKIIDHGQKIQYYYEIYQTIISNLLLSCYNIAQNILFAEKEKNEVLIKTNEIVGNFDILFTENQNHPYIFLLQYCIAESKGLVSLINSSSTLLKTLYEKCLNLIKTLNEMIDLINDKAGMTYLKNFMSSTFTNNDIDQFYDIYDRSLKHLKLLPENLDEYNKIFGSIGPNLNKIRKFFYEEYAPYIDIRHYSTYIFDNTKRKTLLTNTDLGMFISSANPTIQNPFNVLSSTTFKPRIGYLGADLPTSLQLFGINFKNEIYINNSSGTQILDNVDKTLGAGYGIGKFGILIPTNSTINKKEKAILSIRSYFNDHLKHIKFMLIQKVIELFNDKDAKDDDVSKTLLISDTNIRDSIETIKNEYLKSLKENFSIIDNLDSILFTAVGKIADKLIILHLNNLIYSNVNDHVKTFMDKEFGLTTLNPNKNIIKEIINITPFKVDTGFNLSLNALFDEVIETYFKKVPSTTNFNSLMYTVNVMDDMDPIIKQFQIYDANYSTASNILEKRCYTIKPEIIDILAKTSNVNEKDSNGSSPIFYAIKNLHIESIKKLIEHGANVYIPTTSNKTGLTPYKYALNNYEQHIGLFFENEISIKGMIDKFTLPIFTQIKEGIEANPDFKNNIIRYMNIIFPQLIVMFNNLLYFYAKSYGGGWTFENQKSLERLFMENNLISGIDTKLPILQDLENSVIKYSIKLDTLNKKTLEQESNIKKNNEQIANLNNTIDNLKKEVAELGKIPTPDTFTISLIRETNIKIADLGKKINELTNGINSNKTLTKQKLNIESNMQTKELTLYNELKTKANNFVSNEKYLGKTPNMYNNIFRQVSLLYKDIFDYVIMDNKLTDNVKYTGYEDYFLYNKIWQNNINSEVKMKSIYNIELLSSLLQKSLIQKLKSNNKSEINSATTDLLLLKDSYDKILVPTIKNMFELPQNYDVTENYVLYETLDIMKHIIETVLCSNLYYAIIKVITKYVLTISPQELTNNKKIKDLFIVHSAGKIENYNDFVREIVNRIINPNHLVAGKTDGAKLHEYILKEMPNYLVKIGTNIYKDELDEEKSIKSFDELFQNIINIIVTNDILPNLKKTSLITNLENYVFKYYKEVFMQIIPKMKIVIDNYCRFILNESRFIDIIIELNIAVKSEMDIAMENNN